MRIAGKRARASGRYTSTESFTPSRIGTRCPRVACTPYCGSEYLPGAGAWPRAGETITRRSSAGAKRKRVIVMSLVLSAFASSLSCGGDAMAHDTFRAGDLTAVIGDNSASGMHRAGYNGLWSLTHREQPVNAFVPTVAGL